MPTNLAETPRNSNPLSSDPITNLRRIAIRIVQSGEVVEVPGPYSYAYPDARPSHVIRLGSFSLNASGHVFHRDLAIGQVYTGHLNGIGIGRAFHLRIAGEPWDGRFKHEKPGYAESLDAETRRRLTATGTRGDV